MKFAQDVVVLIVGIGMMTWPHEATAKNNKAITLTPIGATAPALAATRAEIAAYDPATKRVFAINLALLPVDVLDISDPAAPVLEFTIPLIGAPNSIAIRDGVVAVAIENAVKTNPGFAQFLTTAGHY